MPRARTKPSKPEPYEPSSHLDTHNPEIDSDPNTMEDKKPNPHTSKDVQDEKPKPAPKSETRRARVFTPEIRALAVEWVCDKIKDEHLAELGSYSIYKQFVAGGGLRKRLVAAAEGE